METQPVSHTVRKPPNRAKAMLNTQRMGFTSTAASTFGNTRCEAGLMPITSSASICSVTRILPISAVMREPRLPTNNKL